jgi:hypothetical protein
MNVYGCLRGRPGVKWGVYTLLVYLPEPPVDEEARLKGCSQSDDSHTTFPRRFTSDAAPIMAYGISHS